MTRRDGGARPPIDADRALQDLQKALNADQPPKWASELMGELGARVDDELRADNARLRRRIRALEAEARPRESKLTEMRRRASAAEAELRQKSSRGNTA